MHARVYDDVAETYQRINMPRMFAAAGKALATEVAPTARARMLDLGAGTGAVARGLRDIAGPDALVVVTDASHAMLHQAARAGFKDGVVALLPHLPFATASFEIATSAFVLTHLDDPEAGVREMARVLQSGGRMGLSAWYAPDDDVASEWSRVIGYYVAPERLEDVVRQTLPGQGRFSRPGSLAELLRATGFENIVARDHAIACAMTVDEYVVSRQVCAAGRALKSLMVGAAWVRMDAAVRAALTARFPGGIRFTAAFHTAVGTHPV
jgi:ubiquinone/menaquinone biosynthesis C-methylase UbiE